MSIRRLADGAPTQDAGFRPNPTPNGAHPQSSSVMPVGPDVDVNSILGPLIDGSFSQAQGQAAIMAGVRAAQPNEATMPMKSTAPLPGGTAPLGVPAANGATPQANLPKVPPQF